MFKKLFIPILLLVAIVMFLPSVAVNTIALNNNSDNYIIGVADDNSPPTMIAQSNTSCMSVVNLSEIHGAENVSADNSLNNITKQTSTANVMVEANLTTGKINLMDTQGAIGESPQVGQNLTANLTGTNTMLEEKFGSTMVQNNALFNSAAVASMNCSSNTNRLTLYDMKDNYNGAKNLNNFT